MRFLTLGAALAGSLLGGGLGELVGVRLTLAVGVSCSLLAALTLGLSPLRKLKDI